jgi:hypothetical protein
MLRWITSLPFGAVALLVAHVGCAQDYPTPHISLDKVDQVRLTGATSSPRRPAKSTRITTSMKFILNTASIPFVEGFPDYTYDPTLTDEQQAKQDRQHHIPALWVSGDAMSIRSGCIYHIGIRVEESVKPTTLVYSGKPFSGSVELWSSSYYGIAPPSDLTSELSQRVEEALKQFVNLRADDIKAAAQ